MDPLGKAPADSRQPFRRFFGILTRKERWGLSGRGWSFFFFAALFALALVFLGVYPFLAVTDRVEATVLVFEGWGHGYAAQAAAEEFRRGG